MRLLRWLVRLLYAALTTRRHPRRYTQAERDILDAFEDWRRG